MLFERLDFIDLQRELQSLPPPNIVAILPERPALVRHFPNPMPPTEPIVPRQIARAPVQRGFAQDYSIVSSAANLVFAGDSTYLLTGTVNASSTTTFEGGAVLKFVNTNNAGLVTLGDINCTARAYYPCVFTAASEVPSAKRSPGPASLSGYYGGTALETDASNERLQWLRFSYLANASRTQARAAAWKTASSSTAITRLQPPERIRRVEQCPLSGLGGRPPRQQSDLTLYQGPTMDSCTHFDYEPIYTGGTFCVTDCSVW